MNNNKKPKSVSFLAAIAVEQLTCSMFPSILTFDFDSILGSFLLFGALTGYFCGWGRIQKLFVGLLYYMTEQK